MAGDALLNLDRKECNNIGEWRAHGFGESLENQGRNQTGI